MLQNLLCDAISDQNVLMEGFHRRSDNKALFIEKLNRAIMSLRPIQSNYIFFSGV